MLVSEDLEIDIQADSHLVIAQDDIFVIKVGIRTKSRDKTTFSPSNSFVKLANGQIVHARGFTCSYTSHSHSSYLSDYRLLSTPQEITWGPKVGGIQDVYKYGCFNLYFASVEKKGTLVLIITCCVAIYCLHVLLCQGNQEWMLLGSCTT
jgi:hypothetical protein